MDMMYILFALMVLLCTGGKMRSHTVRHYLRVTLVVVVVVVSVAKFNF
jgi:hypothetical protein